MRILQFVYVTSFTHSETPLTQLSRPGVQYIALYLHITVTALIAIYQYITVTQHYIELSHYIRVTQHYILLYHHIKVKNIILYDIVATTKWI
jgi:hypothetical protein